jgi:hypothetical protein
MDRWQYIYPGIDFCSSTSVGLLALCVLLCCGRAGQKAWVRHTLRTRRRPGQVSERCRSIPLQTWLFTPESQWQSRGQIAYLTGVCTGTGNAPARPSRRRPTTARRPSAAMPARRAFTGASTTRSRGSRAPQASAGTPLHNCLFPPELQW